MVCPASYVSILLSVTVIIELLSSSFAISEASWLGRRNLCASVVTVLESPAEEECDIFHALSFRLNLCFRGLCLVEFFRSSADSALSFLFESVKRRLEDGTTSCSFGLEIFDCKSTVSVTRI